MSNKLSHSSVTKYQSCPKAWEFHYKQRIRPILQTSALAFGTAIDQAIGALLKGEGDPHATFDYWWTSQDINGVKEDLNTSTKIVYGNSDFDKDLLSEPEILALESRHVNPFEYFETVLDKKKKEGFLNLSEEEKVFLNFANWLSMRAKGHIMINSFQEKAMGKIRRVLALQKEIKLENGDGDSITGFADIVAEVEGYGVVVLDLKTSAMFYDENTSVLTSPQLSLYVNALSEEFKTRYAGYIVLIKKIIKNREKKCSLCGFDGSGARHKTCANEIDGKRCNGPWIEKLKPEAPVQFLIAEIPEQTENIVLENFDHINQSIKNGIFHRNLNSCEPAWGRCPYYNICYHGDSSETITIPEKKVENK